MSAKVMTRETPLQLEDLTGREGQNRGLQGVLEGTMEPEVEVEIRLV